MDRSYTSLVLGIAGALALGSAAHATDTVHVAFAVTQNFGSGFEGQIELRNDASWTIPNWRLEFDFAVQISSIWNGQILSHTGNHYVIGPPGWDDGNLSPGESIAPGFVASPLSNVAPTNGTLNGVPVSMSGDSTAPPRAVPVAAPPWPRRVLAPYVDATTSSPPDLAMLAQSGGPLGTTNASMKPVRFFNLAFVVASGSTCSPSWGSNAALTPAGGHFLSTINALRQLGGDVMVSFGGAAHTELAAACGDVPTLVTQYQSVIDAYALTHVDFDIEGTWVGDTMSIDRRSAAIAQLQADAAAAHRELHVWFTLPVLPSGLDGNGMYVVRSALSHGAHIDGVNIMAMDYTQTSAPNPVGHMGDYATQAGTNLNAQLRTAYAEIGQTLSESQAWRMIGITPMIGLNDNVMEVFTLANAAQLRDFAIAHDLASLAFWSLGRDNQCGGPTSEPSPSCSSVSQAQYQFAQMLSGVLSASCTGDFDGNGSVSVQDIFEYLNAWLAGDLRADVNGGGLSVQDIFDFLAAWFGGCT